MYTSRYSPSLVYTSPLLACESMYIVATHPLWFISPLLTLSGLYLPAIDLWVYVYKSLLTLSGLYLPAIGLWVYVYKWLLTLSGLYLPAIGLWVYVYKWLLTLSGLYLPAIGLWVYLYSGYSPSLVYTSPLLACESMCIVATHPLWFISPIWACTYLLPFGPLHGRQLTIIM